MHNKLVATLYFQFIYSLKNNAENHHAELSLQG